ncbi:hypothetical protein ABIB95_005931 [Bradyrhizobium sp. LA2.1]
MLRFHAFKFIAAVSCALVPCQSLRVDVLRHSLDFGIGEVRAKCSLCSWLLYESLGFPKGAVYVGKRVRGSSCSLATVLRCQ